jgi:hypothetical protein
MNGLLDYDDSDNDSDCVSSIPQNLDPQGQR